MEKIKEILVAARELAQATLQLSELQTEAVNIQRRLEEYSKYHGQLMEKYAKLESEREEEILSDVYSPETEG